jgi:hypothetical protein
MMNRKTLLWVVVAFLAGGFFAARQNIIEHQPKPPASEKVKPPPAPPKVVPPKEHDVAVILIAQMPKSGKAKDIGCGNTTKAMTQKSTFQGDVVEDALKVLFALTRAGYENGELYNALYQSNLKVQSVQTRDDVVTVHLTGNIKMSGECDIPRVRAQIIDTIKAASDAKKIVVWVNDKSLDEALSLEN